MQRVNGPSAVVSGAGRGIGRAIALLLGDLGYAVGLSARTESEIRQVAEELSRRGARSVLVTGDIRDERTSATLVERTSELGPVSVAIANAGQARSKLLVDTTADELREVLEINVVGVHNLIRAATKAMIDGKTPNGRIVAIASTASVRGMRFTSAYTASKHAVLGMIRSAALEVAKHGITLNAVCPGWVDTAMFDETLANIVKKTGRSTAEAREAIESKIPMGRVATVDDVVETVRWLLQAPHVTGQPIVIDGGESL